ncbi:hypothetical protein MOXK02_03920 [Moraxella sp. K02]
MRQLFKKIMVCFLAIQLAFFSPVSANAASPAGWTFSGFDAVAGVVSAVKNGARATATVAKSPVTSKIAKGILGGVIAGAAIPLAINQITGIAFDAIDWVLDPANNAIKYRDKNAVTGEYSFTDPICTVGYAKGYRASETGVAAWTYYGIHNATGYATFTNSDGGHPVSQQCLPAVPVASNDWKSIPIPTVSDKIYDNAKTGHADSVAAVTTAVADLTKEGEYDKPLDLAKPEEKTCEAGYVKNSAGECVKKDEPKTCPAGSFKVGDICIEPPVPKDDGSCGECCEQLLQAISALAKLQTELNQKLLDSDDKTREEIKKIQDKIDLLATDLKDVNSNIIKLVDEAKKLNTTVEQLDKNQELRFKNLTDTIKQANKELLDSDKITQEKLDKIDQLLTQSLDEFKKTNEKLDKVNENLEKMHKCNETEFNKKMCDMSDWFQQKFDKPDENGKVDIKDFELPSIDTNKVKFDNQCPAPTPLDISISSLMVNFHDELNYQPLCDFMTKLRPFVVGFGYVSGAFIVAGVGRKNG